MRNLSNQTSANGHGQFELWEMNLDGDHREVDTIGRLIEVEIISAVERATYIGKRTITSYDPESRLFRRIVEHENKPFAISRYGWELTVVVNKFETVKWFLGHGSNRRLGETLANMPSGTVVYASTEITSTPSGKYRWYTPVINHIEYR